MLVVDEHEVEPKRRGLLPGILIAVEYLEQIDREFTTKFAEIENLVLFRDRMLDDAAEALWDPIEKFKEQVYALGSSYASANLEDVDLDVVVDANFSGLLDFSGVYRDLWDAQYEFSEKFFVTRRVQWGFIDPAGDDIMVVTDRSCSGCVVLQGYNNQDPFAEGEGRPFLESFMVFELPDDPRLTLMRTAFDYADGVFQGDAWLKKKKFDEHFQEEMILWHDELRELETHYWEPAGAWLARKRRMLRND